MHTSVLALRGWAGGVFICMRGEFEIWNSNLSKLAINLKFEIQLCLGSKLVLCACASGNNANPELVAKLLPSLCDCRGICLWFAGFNGYDGICVWIRARHMNFSCPTVTLGHMNKSTAYEFPVASLVYLLMVQAICVLRVIWCAGWLTLWASFQLQISYPCCLQYRPTYMIAPRAGYIIYIILSC